MNTTTDQRFRLPSPLHEIHDDVLKEKSVRLFLKRDDLIHDEISGNKWRKLKYNIEQAQVKKVKAILTFGGAYSNHIAATAKACEIFGIKSIGIIRGQYADQNNPTLQFASQCGMKLIYADKEEYDQRHSYNYHHTLKEHFGNILIIPEGGANLEGVSGCMEIAREIDEPYRYICSAIGTGTTLTGLILSKPGQSKVLGFSVFKSAEGIQEMIASNLLMVLQNKEAVTEYRDEFSIIDGYGFGGYARINDELIHFINSFYRQHKIKLDLIYTGKMMFGIYDLIHQDYFQKGDQIVALHTGGLQGNAGFEQKMNKNLFS